MDYQYTRVRRIPTATIVILAIQLVGLTACSSTTELPPQMTKDLSDLRDQLVQGKAQIQMTCNAARDLTQRPQAQLEPQISKLKQRIDELDSFATQGRSQFASAQEHATAYFANWDKQMQGMSDDMAMQGQERLKQSKASLEKLKASAADARAEFQPFMASLQEVSRYLSTDTTAAGVKVATPQINKALDRENSLQAKIDSIIGQIDAMKGGK